MTEEQFLDAIFDREGRVYAEPPKIDQPTGPGGITLPTYRKFVDPIGTVDDLKRLTPDTARPIVRAYIRDCLKRYSFDAIADEPLRWQMLDFAFNSGPGTAIRWLQRVLRVSRTMTMDHATIDAANTADPWLLHHAVIAGRALLINLGVDDHKISRDYEHGLYHRALSFSRLPIP